ncbi:hypothetical protein [Streptomyces tropicalis]|uniref:Uncharacterized protein n=1 Tax=Streptomyces tropicalis TaxID=3034234 RepID=A0ABT6A3K5_9ACTN|nr:hypothetical protein [Streptomyces tropicalis]MDF3299229.1 hypothetical protein [Streptomyces tropicalis]
MRFDDTKRAPVPPLPRRRKGRALHAVRRDVCELSGLGGRDLFAVPRDELRPPRRRARVRDLRPLTPVRSGRLRS